MIESGKNINSKSANKSRLAKMEYRIRNKFSKDKFLSGFAKGTNVHVFGVELDESVLNELSTQFCEYDETGEKSSCCWNIDMEYSSKVRRYLKQINDEILSVMKNTQENSNNIFIICSYDESCSGSLPYKLFTYLR